MNSYERSTPSGLALFAAALLGCGSVVTAPGNTSTLSSSGTGGAATTTGTGGTGGSCAGACPSCTAFTPWSRTFSQPGLETFLDDWVSVSPDGSVFSTTLELKVPSPQFTWAGDHLIKIDPAGQVVWQLDDAHILAPLADDACGAFVVGSVWQNQTSVLGVPVTCAAYACPYVARLDASGAPLWLDAFDAGAGFSVYFGSARATPDHRIIITGELHGALDFGAVHVESGPGYANFVVALSPDGTGLWGRLIHNNTDPHVSFGAPTGMAVSPAGDVVVAGRLGAEIDFGGGPVPNPGYPSAAGTYVAAFDPSGNLRFGNVYYESTNGLWGWRVAFDPSGNVVIAGRSTGTTDLGGGPIGDDMKVQTVVAKLDLAGNHVWSAAVTELSAEAYLADAMPGLAVSGAGHIFVSADNAVIELDASGSSVATHALGGSGRRFVNSIRFGPGGALIVAGTFDEAVDLGQGLLTAGDMRSAFAGVLDL